jgi:hypothetical protein
MMNNNLKEEKMMDNNKECDFTLDPKEVRRMAGAYAYDRVKHTCGNPLCKNPHHLYIANNFWVDLRNK